LEKGIEIDLTGLGKGLKECIGKRHGNDLETEGNDQKRLVTNQVALKSILNAKKTFPVELKKLKAYRE